MAGRIWLGGDIPEMDRLAEAKRDSCQADPSSPPGTLLLLLSHFSHVLLCVTPIDGSPPGSPVPEILQARTPEWAAISFSGDILMKCYKSKPYR